MNQYSETEKAEVVEIYFKNNCSIVSTQREFKRIKKTKKAPDPKSITNWVKHFRAGSLSDRRKNNSGRQVTAATSENKDAVKKLVEKQPNISVRKGGLRVGISPSTFWRILKELGMHPYKIQVVHKIPSNCTAKCLNFSIEILDKSNKEIDPDKIWCSDGAHFYLSGEINRQNYRYWGTSNQHNILESPLHPQKVTVWIAICGTGLIGLYFFDGTVNHENYLEVSKKFHRTASKRKMIQNYHFMQDGAPPHRKDIVLNYLKSKFENRLIALGTDFAWPPYSPDLNPYDFFLWDHLKDKVFNEQFNDIETLKKKIISVSRSIKTEILTNVFKSFVHRLEMTKSKAGHHFQQFL